MRHAASLIALCLLLSACGGREEEPAAPPPGDETAPEAVAEPAAGDEAGAEAGTLEWAVQGAWRGEQAARDEWRNPQETLEFFDIDPSGTVVEIWPAAGWYTQILAPWIAANGGTYVAAYFPTGGEERLERFRDEYIARFSDPLYGTVQMTEFGPETGPILPPESADAILTFRNVHNWMARGFAEKAFADFYAALKPGGVLGVVEHRLPASVEQDPRAASGYVQQDYVIALAQEAGFELAATSEVNANPADTADHPFGVWTLPPVSRVAAPGEQPAADFDPAPYQAIGESDRMTLRFVKPAAEAEGGAGEEDGGNG